MRIEDAKFEIVNKKSGKRLPRDYHCSCSFCKGGYSGMLIRSDGSKYSRRVRSYYYDEGERVHPAKTPLHLARYCVQTYTESGDWVFDPTIGAGTTAVEALNFDRNVVGIELCYYDNVLLNIRKNCRDGKRYKIFHGDAIDCGKFLKKAGRKFRLIINNPPYSADTIVQWGFTGSGKEVRYETGESGNLAFKRENDEYYKFIRDIYQEACKHLLFGGYFVVGVKDMMRQKKPYLLHFYLGKILEEFLSFKEMILLPHYPPTLFMNTYRKRYPEVEKIPLYQTILVFRKEKNSK